LEKDLEEILTENKQEKNKQAESSIVVSQSKNKFNDKEEQETHQTQDFLTIMTLEFEKIVMPICDETLLIGLVQVINLNFPKNNNQRKFSTNHYKRRLTNDEYISLMVSVFSVKIFSILLPLQAIFNNE